MSPRGNPALWPHASKTGLLAGGGRVLMGRRVAGEGGRGAKMLLDRIHRGITGCPEGRATPMPSCFVYAPPPHPLAQGWPCERTLPRQLRWAFAFCTRSPATPEHLLESLHPKWVAVARRSCRRVALSRGQGIVRGAALGPRRFLEPPQQRVSPCAQHVYLSPAVVRRGCAPIVEGTE